MYLKRLDKVQVVRGKSADKGKVGAIKKVFIDDNKIIVEGVNLVKKHQKPNNENAQGGVIEMEAPIDASNVMLLDPKTNKPTRVGFEVRDGKKVRIAKKSGEPIDKV